MQFRHKILTKVICIVAIFQLLGLGTVIASAADENYVVYQGWKGAYEYLHNGQIPNGKTSVRVPALGIEAVSNNESSVQVAYCFNKSRA